jgi:uncharacterized protein
MDPTISWSQKKALLSSHIFNKFLARLAMFVLAPGLALYLLVGSVAADRLTKPFRVFNDGITPGRYQLEYEDVRFPARDGKANIAAWYIPSPENKRVVILVHGRNASRTELFLGHSLELAAALHRAGFTVMLIDLRGHGKSSTGRFTFGLQERYDVLGGLDWLTAHGYQPGKIGVMGISLGSAAAIGAAADDPRIGALVSDSGFADITPMIKSRWETESGLPLVFLHSTRLMIWLEYGYDITRSKPVAEIGKVSPRPILLIHCQNDAVIPYANVEQLSAAAPGAELWLIPFCIHGQSYNAEPAAYEHNLVNFFNEGLQ